MTLYEDLKEAKIPVDNHESDLYCLATPESVAMCKAWEKEYSCYTSQVDGKQWLDVPFAYDPYWTEKAVTGFAHEHGFSVDAVKKLVEHADHA